MQQIDKGVNKEVEREGANARLMLRMRH